MGRSLNEPTVASLKPALLARKGGAKPAMRQQLAALEAAFGPMADDLGWNDFGPETEAGGDVVPITRAATPKRQAPAAGKAGAEAGDGRKAAFTLRLDPERHLKLRMACTLDARSAQALMIEALDRLLGAMPELEPLVRDATALRGKRRPAEA